MADVAKLIDLRGGIGGGKMEDSKQTQKFSKKNPKFLRKTPKKFAGSLRSPAKGVCRTRS